MSRTYKDAPHARRARAAAKAAKCERPLTERPLIRVPVTVSWDELADAALTTPWRAPRLLAAADAYRSGARLLATAQHDL